ncbi:N4BP2_1 [Sanghuangporus sanghuang]
MGDEECRRLREYIQRLKDYIDDQSRRHSSEIKSVRDELKEEIKYSKKLRTELDEEYKYCERLRSKLSEKARLIEDLRDDLEDERTYSVKLERKLDKRAKIIKELEADLLDLEDEYAEARTALKRMDQLRRELDDTKLNRLYDKQRVKQLQDEVHSLRSASLSGSPSLTPAYAIRYLPSDAASRTQVHVLSGSSCPVSPRPSPQPVAHNLAAQPQTVPRQVVNPPPSGTPELESDYSDVESDLQEGRLTEEEGLSEDDEASQYSDVEEEVPPHEAEPEQAGGAPGENLRDLAAKEGRLADREYERASEAYASGDRDFAKKLRDKGAQHRHNSRNYHRMAAAEIFNHHNPEYDINPNARVKIDLHHLHVREAKEYVERHIDLCRRAKLSRTEIISGRGNHSVDGVAKIRPAIMELMESQRDVEVDEHETNPGRIVVRFLDVSGGGSDGHSNTNSASNSRSPSRMRDGPRHADVDDVFETGRTRLRAATHAAEEVRHGLDEIERGMNSMRLKPEAQRTLRGMSPEPRR